MSAVFRKLSNKRYWEGKSWLEAWDVSGDATRCLKTDDNRLSVYVLENPDVQIRRVVAALALTRESLECVDLAIVPDYILEECKIRAERQPGVTPDSSVNGWHVDLVELSIFKIAELAKGIKGGGEIKRYQPARVKQAIQTSLEDENVDIGRINPKLMKSLERKGFQIQKETGSAK